MSNFPGYPLVTNRTNATPMTNVHPPDHNSVNAAANDLQAQINAATAATALLDANSKAACQLYDASESITEGTTYNIISWATEQYDPLSWHAPGTPTRITPTIAGWYTTLFAAKLVTSASVVSIINARPRLNGATGLTMNEDSRSFPTGGSSLNPSMTGGGPLIHLNGTTDYLECQFSMDSTDATTRAWEVAWTLLLRIRD